MIPPMAPAIPKPIYVLNGDDEFLKDSHRRRILSEVVGQADPQLCISTFDGNVELGEVLVELRTLPFLAPHRVVIVRDADAFVAANREALERYLDSPCPTGSLILMVSSWNSAHKIAKKAAAIGETANCSVGENENLPRRLGDWAAQRGKKIAPDAVRQLIEWVGRDLAAMEQEIEKLAAFTGQRPIITAADVSAVVVNTTEVGTFALTNELTAGNAPGALKALGGMLNVKGDEFKVAGLLASHLRRMLKCQQQVVAGMSVDAVLPRNLPPNARTQIMDLLKRRPLSRMQQDFRRLIATDLAMKSGQTAATALQDLVVALCT